MIPLKALYRVATSIKLEKLCELSKLVEEKTGILVSPNKPIVGKYAVLQGSNASWATGIMSSKRADFPFHPLTVSANARDETETPNTELTRKRETLVLIGQIPSPEILCQGAHGNEPELTESRDNPFVVA